MLVAEGDTGEVLLGIGSIDTYNVEVLEFGCYDTALLGGVAISISF